MLEEEEEPQLPQDLDMQLFEQIDMAHELDDRYRRVYEGFGNRLLCYEDEDGNDVMRYETPYPDSVIDAYSDPSDPFPTNNHNHIHNPAPAYDPPRAANATYARPLITDIDDDMAVISGDEEWYSCPETYEEEPPDYLFIIEPRHFATFLAAQDEELPQFESDRGRVARWVDSIYVGDEDDEDEEGCMGVWERERESSDAVSLWSEIY